MGIIEKKITRKLKVAATICRSSVSSKFWLQYGPMITGKRRPSRLPRESKNKNLKRNPCSAQIIAIPTTDDGRTLSSRAKHCSQLLTLLKANLRSLIQSGECQLCMHQHICPTSRRKPHITGSGLIAGMG